MADKPVYLMDPLETIPPFNFDTYICDGTGLADYRIPSGRVAQYVLVPPSGDITGATDYANITAKANELGLLPDIPRGVCVALHQGQRYYINQDLVLPTNVGLIGLYDKALVQRVGSLSANYGITVDDALIANIEFLANSLCDGIHLLNRVYSLGLDNVRVWQALTNSFRIENSWGSIYRNLLVSSGGGTDIDIIQCNSSYFNTLIQSNGGFGGVGPFIRTSSSNLLAFENILSESSTFVDQPILHIRSTRASSFKNFRIESNTFDGTNGYVLIEPDGADNRLSKGLRFSEVESSIELNQPYTFIRALTQSDITLQGVLINNVDTISLIDLVGGTHARPKIIGCYTSQISPANHVTLSSGATIVDNEPVAIPNMSEVNVPDDSLFRSTEQSQLAYRGPSGGLYAVRTKAAFDKVLEADDLNLLDADPVTQWDTRQGDSFVQVSAPLQPTYTASAINGHPAVFFDGTEILEFVGQLMLNTRGTVVAVVNVPGAITAQSALYTQSNDAENTVFAMKGFTGTDRLLHRARDGAVFNDILVTASGTVIQPASHVLIWSSDGSTVRMRIDGVEQTVVEDTGTNQGRWFGNIPNVTRSTIGGGSFQTGPGSFFTGHIACIRLRENELTTAEMEEAESELGLKYGITVTPYAVQKTTQFYMNTVSDPSGYAWRYSSDLTLRESETNALTLTQCGIQPPGTPTTGQAYLDAYGWCRKQYLLQAAQDVADALINTRYHSGGWDFIGEFDPTERLNYNYAVGTPNAGTNFSQLDDDNTQSCIRFLMRLDQATGFLNKTLHDATIAALDSLVAAQYQNGSWTIGYDGPLTGDLAPGLQASYQDPWPWTYPGVGNTTYCTINDMLTPDCMLTLLEANSIYNDPAYGVAAYAAADWLLDAIMPVSQPGWAEQYGDQVANGMQPQWGRIFEPPAVSGSLTQFVCDALMTFYEHSGQTQYRDPVQPAINWLIATRLPNGTIAKFLEQDIPGGNGDAALYTKGIADSYELTYDRTEVVPGEPGIEFFEKEDRTATLQARLDSLSGPWGGDPGWNRLNPTDPGTLSAIINQYQALLDSRYAFVESGSLVAHPYSNGILEMMTFQYAIVKMAEGMVAGVPGQYTNPIPIPVP